MAIIQQAADSKAHLLRLCTKARPLVIAAVLSSSATASADPGGAQNIPVSSANSPKVASVASGGAQEGDPYSKESELPLPYESWSGTGLRPPPSRTDRLPPPLARARQLPRRPLELTTALGVFLPNCGSGSIDDRACTTVSPGTGLDLAVLYRVTPYFAFGAEAALSGFRTTGGGLASSDGGGARFFGVAGRVYFAEDGVWDPYVALTLGGGSVSLRDGGELGEKAWTSGFGGRVAGGIDYVLGSHLRIGPSASFARWVAWQEERCAGTICRDEPAAYGRVLGFATLGFRVTASFGDVL